MGHQVSYGNSLMGHQAGYGDRLIGHQASYGDSLIKQAPTLLEKVEDSLYLLRSYESFRHPENK